MKLLLMRLDFLEKDTRVQLLRGLVPVAEGRGPNTRAALISLSEQEFVKSGEVDKCH